MCGRDDPLYFTLPVSAALGFKIFCNAALRAKMRTMPTAELCDPNQAFVHCMLENGFTVLSLENENLSREKKNQNSCDYLLCWLSVHLFALREFALQKYWFALNLPSIKIKATSIQWCKMKIAVLMKPI